MLKKMQVLAGCALRAWGRGLVLPPFSELQVLCSMELCSSDAGQEVKTNSTPKAGKDNPNKVLSPVWPSAESAEGTLEDCPVQRSRAAAEADPSSRAPLRDHIYHVWSPHTLLLHFQPAPPLEPICPRYSSSLIVKCLDNIYLLPKDVRINNFF